MISDTVQGIVTFCDLQSRYAYVAVCGSAFYVGIADCAGLGHDLKAGMCVTCDLLHSYDGIELINVRPIDAC
jgi:hypothetical protein